MWFYMVRARGGGTEWWGRPREQLIMFVHSEKPFIMYRILQQHHGQKPSNKASCLKLYAKRFEISQLSLKSAVLCLNVCVSCAWDGEGLHLNFFTFTCVYALVFVIYLIISRIPFCLWLVYLKKCSFYRLYTQHMYVKVGPPRSRLPNPNPKVPREAPGSTSESCIGHRATVSWC